MPKLNLYYKDLCFESPFILASAPPTRNAEMIARAFEYGWSGAVTKTICLNYQDIVHTSPRFVGSTNYLKNIELISERPVQEWVDDIKFLKDKFPEKIVIASIAAEANNISNWQKLTAIVEEAGADIIELNLSCPHGLPEMKMGNACCDLPELSAEITRSVKSTAKRPVWVKLSPNVTDINYLATLCLESGADGITAINTVKGFAGFDIFSKKPKLNIDNKSTYGGYSGELIRPIALKAVTDIAFKNECFISATGGINNWEDAVEFMMLGASTVQVCTKVMYEGFQIIDELKEGLNKYLEIKNYDSVQNIIGSALNIYESYNNLDKNYKSLPEINNEKCIKCGKCFVSCNDGAYQAIKYTSGNYPSIDYSACTGCGLCGIVCPTNCIILEETEKIYL